MSIFDKHRGFPETRVALIIKQILHALIYSHRRGIIHKGIRPSNIFVENNSDGLEFLIKLDGYESAV